MHTQSEKQEWQGVVRWRPQQPIFGRLSLWGLCAAGIIAVLSLLMPMFWSYDESSLGIIVLGLGLAGILCIASFMAALLGVLRDENPRWPAVTGFVLSLLPAFGGVYLLCGAPW